MSAPLPRESGPTTPQPGDVWFRMSDYRVANWGEEGDGPGRPAIRTEEYTVRRLTPRGVWIRDGFVERWVSCTARKRFAYPTIEEARASFIARKQRQLEIHEAKVGHVRVVLALLGLAVPPTPGGRDHA